MVTCREFQCLELQFLPPPAKRYELGVVIYRVRTQKRLRESCVGSGSGECEGSLLSKAYRCCNMFT